MVRTLATAFRVTTLGLAEFADDRIESVVLPPATARSRLLRLAMLKLRRFEALLWSPELLKLAESLRARDYDLVVTHDVDLLPMAAAVAKAGKVMFDAREFYPRHFDDSRTWRFFYQPLNQYLCATYLPRCDRMITVSEGFARAYEESFGIRALVVESLPPFFDLQPQPTDPAHIRIVHHGNATRPRRIEGMIRVMDHLPNRFSLDLYLRPTDPAYHAWLCSEAASRPGVHIRPVVPYADLIPTTNRYDIGIFLCPPTTFNLRHTVPNKLFEFVQARLAVAIGPLPDQSAVLRRLGCGLIASDFEPATMARLIEAADAAALDVLKARAHEAARTQNADVERGRLLELVLELVAG
jgi:hypothetical protein